MIAFLARRNLVRQRARTLLCVLGLGATTALLYDMALLSTGLKASLTHVLAEIGYDLRVLPKGGLPFSSEAVLPNGQALATELDRLPGVADALPLWATTLYFGRAGHAGRRVSAFALGLDPARQTFYRVEAGHAIPDTESADAIPIVLNRQRGERRRIRARARRGRGHVPLRLAAAAHRRAAAVRPRAARRAHR